MVHKTKRPFLLLEVLIALALVALCAIPLIYPHVAIYLSQKEFVSKIELDHKVSLNYVNILEKLHRNEISLDDIRNETLFTLPEGMNGYIGTYSFHIIKEKFSKTLNGPGAMLVELKIRFENPLTRKTQSFSYKVFLGFKSKGEARPLDDTFEEEEDDAL